MWAWSFAVLAVCGLAKDSCSVAGDESLLVQVPEGQFSTKQLRIKNDIVQNASSPTPARGMSQLQGALDSQIPNFQNAQERADAVADTILPDVDTNSSDNVVTHTDSATLATAVVVLIGLDIYVLPSMTRSYAGRVASVFLMLTLSMLFNAAVWWERGESDALLWGTGYVFEWVLSFDNLFAFYLVFKAFKVPDTQVARALAVGVYGAAILRVVFFLFMREALDRSLWVDEAVGVLLIVSGVGAIFEAEDDDEQPDPPWVARCFKWMFGTRLMETYDDAGYMFTHDGARWRVTMLMLAACVIMIVDILFALDSVGVKSHEFTSVYLNLSSSIMAMFTLRQAYFAISALADTFAYFKFGIAAVLAIIGLDLVMSPWGGMDEQYLGVMISSSFAISIVASMVKHRVEAEGIKNNVEAWSSAEQSTAEQFVFKSVR